MSQRFVDEVEQMLRKLRLEEGAELPEVLLDQLNQAFWSFFEDYRLLEEEEKELPDNFAGYVNAQRLFHDAGLEIIHQIMTRMAPNNDEQSLNETERMETESAVNSITINEQQQAPVQSVPEVVQIDSDLLIVNPPAGSVQVIIEPEHMVDSEQPSTSGQPLPSKPDQSKGAVPKQRKVLAAAVGEDCSDWEEDSACADINNLPYVQYEQLVRPFFELPQMTEPNAASLDRILNAITDVQVRAAGMHLSTAQIHKTLIALVQHRMDEMSRQIWTFQLEQVDPTLDDLLHFLLKRSNLLKAAQRHIDAVAERNREQRVRGEASPSPSNRGASTMPQAKKKKTVCPHCRRDHFLHRCDLFKALTLPEKVSVLKRNGLCGNCFSPSHATADCKQGVCKRCNLKHNSLMCGKQND